MVLKQIDSALFREMFLNGVVLLQQNKEKINALNVFPVPDGDTGTNMLMTLKSALSEMQQVRSESLSVLADAVSKGSLRGARGNSGVILSQLFRGFARSIHDKETITAREFGSGAALKFRNRLQGGHETPRGHGSDGKPRDRRSRRQSRRADRQRDRRDAAGAGRGWDVLARTPDMLDVLKGRASWTRAARVFLRS